MLHSLPFLSMPIRHVIIGILSIIVTLVSPILGAQTLPPLLDANSDPSIGRVYLGSLSVIEVEVDYPLAQPADGEKAQQWTIQSSTDADLHPTKVGRFTVTRTVVDPKGESLDVDDILLRHTYYLTLNTPMIVGNTYTIQYAHPTDGTFLWTLTVGSFTGTARAIKLNQFGYNSAARERYAYVGYWMGSQGPLLIEHPLAYRIVTADGSIAGEGKTDPRGFDPSSGEYVQSIDLSTLSKGTYLIDVETIGPSAWFQVGETAYEGYYHALRGLYHERCGSALALPHTPWSRPACHTTAYRNDMLEDFSLNFPSNTPKTNPVAVKGGWHDAGDFDRRPVHLATAAHLLILSEMFSHELADASLNIPESKNSYPDVLDEALWGLSFWLTNKTPDGGIRSGSQSTGHPAAVTADQDKLPYWIYAPNRWTSYYFAGAAAHASRLLRQQGPAGASSALTYRLAALSAWNWAESQSSLGTTSIINSPTYSDSQKQNDIDWARFYAAGQLLAMTGSASFQSVAQDLWPDLKGPVNWDNVHALWGYLKTTPTKIDATLRSDMLNRLYESADQFIGYNNQNPYRHGRNPDYGISWGTGTNPVQYLTPAILAYAFSKQQKYIDAVSLNIDFQLGAHPTGMSWMTGMGYYPPESPLHNDSRYDTIAQPVPGLPINGPFENPYEICGPSSYWKCWVYLFFYPPTSANPAINKVPPFRHYSPWDGMAPMNEFTVWTDMPYTSLAYGFLYAISSEEADSLPSLAPSDYPRNTLSRASKESPLPMPSDLDIYQPEDTIPTPPEKPPVAPPPQPPMVTNPTTPAEPTIGNPDDPPVVTPPSTETPASGGGCSLRR